MCLWAITGFHITALSLFQPGVLHCLHCSHIGICPVAAPSEFVKIAKRVWKASQLAQASAAAAVTLPVQDCFEQGNVQQAMTEAAGKCK